MDTTLSSAPADECECDLMLLSAACSATLFFNDNDVQIIQWLLMDEDNCGSSNLRLSTVGDRKHTHLPFFYGFFITQITIETRLLIETTSYQIKDTTSFSSFCFV